MTVAPLAGAWIETLQFPHHGKKPVVAPLAGAWIETIPGRCTGLPSLSPPSRG